MSNYDKYTQRKISSEIKNLILNRMVSSLSLSDTCIYVDGFHVTKYKHSVYGAWRILYVKRLQVA
jgi:hypothetical protein